MRKFLTTTAAVAIAIPALAFSAQAQTQPQPQANVAPSPAQSETQAAAPAKEQITVDTVLSSIADAGSSADMISSTAELPPVGIIQIKSAENPDVSARVDETVASNTEGVERLRTALSQHAVLGPKLKEGGIDVKSIVAAHMTQDGGLLLFMRA